MKDRKILTFLLTPCITGFLSFATVSCGQSPTPPEPPVDEWVVHEPQSQTIEAVMVDGETSFSYTGFSYENIDILNPDLFVVSAPSFSSMARENNILLEIDIVNLNTHSKTFDVFISIKDGKILDFSSIFLFSYDSKPIVSEQQTFTFSLTGEPVVEKVILSTESQISAPISSGRSTFTFTGFQYRGLELNDTNKDKFTVNTTFFQTGASFKSHITNINFIEHTFDIETSVIEGTAAYVSTTFTFYFDGNKLASVGTNSFTVSLEPSGLPDFRTSEWINLCIQAKQGLSHLQEYYGITSFVGLNRTITLQDNNSYIVTVVGQSCDELVSGASIEGKFASLTFQFRQIISNDQKSSKTIAWNDTKENNDWSTSTIRTFLNTSFLEDYLPIDVSYYVSAIKKNTVKQIDEEVGELEETNEYVWLPSLIELGGETDYEILKQEGQTYEYYLDPATRIERRDWSALDGSWVPCWLRTPCLWDLPQDHARVLVNNAGGIQEFSRYITVDDICGYAPCFCI